MFAGAGNSRQMSLRGLPITAKSESVKGSPEGWRCESVIEYVSSMLSV